MIKTIFLCLMLLSFNHTNSNSKNFTTLEEVYDFWAPNYKELVEKTEYKILDWIDKNKTFLINKDLSVLDLGCADGMVGEFIYSYNSKSKFIGVDFSKNMVERCAKSNVYQEVIHADLSYGLPDRICDKKFDIVLATGCLEFVKNHENLLAQVKNILNTSGQFWLTFQIDTSNVNKLALDTSLNVYTQDKAKEVLLRNGFKVLNFEINNCIYKNSQTKEPASYFMITAEKKIRF